jgi:hypothetical protein
VGDAAEFVGRTAAAWVARALRLTAAGWISLGAALVATWPLAAHPTTAVPLGTEREATIPLFSLWNLWWTADRIPHGFVGFLDAPFFFPNPGVTTYSEPMPFLGTLVSPLWAAGAPPALAYNVALLAVLTLNGVFAYRLSRALLVPTAPALLAALTAVTLPFASDLLGVLPCVALFPMLWTLDGLVRFGRSGWAGWAMWAAGGYAATFFTFQQYALFFASVALVAAIVALSQQRFRRAAAARLGAAGVLCVLLVLTLALPTIRRHTDTGGFKRSPELVKALSARPGDFLTRPDTAVVPIPRRDPADTAGLFPGLFLVGLALVGVAVGLRDQNRRRWVALLGATTVFGFLLALGLNLELAGWRPFGTLRAHVSAIAEIRSPYRAAALVQVCLPVLAALALARVGGRLARGGLALIVCLGVVAAAENLSVPQPLRHVPSAARTAWTSWLRDHPDRTVLVHVPFPAGLTSSDYEVEAWRLFAQIDHHRAIVNGYSGFFPVARTPDGRVYPAYTAFQLAMAREFPSYRLLCVLTKSLGADTLVADGGWLASRSRRMAAFPGFLRPVYTDAKVRLYALAAPRGECEVR